MNISSEKVKEFVEFYDVSKVAKGVSGSFTPEHHAFSLLSSGDRISTVILQVSPQLKRYGGQN